ncbi:MAG TPA: DegT/DnrJ/EryC1/StrS family aminotransferase [Pirellulales bacterium]|jgi:dTDP-4-amino-4,6-dideoxygalactose transaminase|nr:DegT/DnrJ/EryC1/StrS family aminotransferase [Pirellulales bacterium]
MSPFDDHIPLLKPWIDDEELAEVGAVLRSGWVSQGPKVKEFEDRLAAWLAAPFVVATNSATSALHLGLLLAGLQRGDRVVLPASTCMATVNALFLAGGVPVFADIDARTFNMEPACARAALDDDVKGVLVVHQVGLAADLDGFRELASERGLFLVEDAATALGAKYRGRFLGSHGNPTVFSLHPRKMITTGEGGLLTLFQQGADERARRLRSAGASISDLERHRALGTLKQDYPEPGFNYRLTDIQAAVGLAQLRKVERMLAERAGQAVFYDRRLAEVDEVRPPYVPPYAVHCYSSYCITLPGARDDAIDEVLGHMADRGISCRRGIGSLCREPYFERACRHISLPNSDAVARQTMFLPIYPGLDQRAQERVVTALKEAIVQFLPRARIV